MAAIAIVAFEPCPVSREGCQPFHHDEFGSVGSTSHHHVTDPRASAPTHEAHITGSEGGQHRVTVDAHAAESAGGDHMPIVAEHCGTSME